MLDRPVIKQEFEHKYPQIIRLYNADLNDAKAIYDAYMKSIVVTTEKPHRNKNMPEVAGALTWSSQLRARIERSMTSFKYIEHP